MNDFCVKYSLSSLIKEPIFYKHSANPSYIDLILTNSLHNFQNSIVVETGLSDFNRMIVTVLKTTFQRLPLKIRKYRNYSNLDNGMFRAFLFHESSKKMLKTLKNLSSSA